MITAVLAVALAMAPQEPQGPPPPHAPEAEALRVFLDCNTFTCDLDFLRTEITFVSYVLDRVDADVHVLVTTQSTGGGGTEYTLAFIGLRRLAGHTDTLRYVASVDDTPDEIRHGMAQVLRLGLVRYVAGTDLAQQLDIRYRPRGAGPPGAPPPPPPGRDRWNHWVFSIGTSGNFNGEQSSNSSYLSGNLSATRITDDWRISISGYGSHSVSRYQLDSVTWFESRTDRYSADLQAVRSLGRHWSAGLIGSALKSTYDNLDSRLRARPSIEYDVFPYDQSTRRLLTVRYGIGVEADRYTDTTIYGRTSEVRSIHGLDISLNTTQPWGQAFISMSSLQYLHDLSKREVSFSGNMSVRLVRGLSVNWFGGYSIIHDQLALPAAGATQQEILVRQQQLATGYSYFAGFGLSYRFGSIFNNIVNPRFGGSSGGGMMIMMM